MARIGLEKFYAGVYNYANGAVSYTGSKLFGKAVDLEIEWDFADDNDLYADNVIVENDGREPSGGTVKINTDNLDPAAFTLLSGITPVAKTLSDESTVQEFEIGKDGHKTPYVGFGSVVNKMVGGVQKYRAIVIRKAKFPLGNEAAETKGESIDWKTDEIEGTIYKPEVGGFETWIETESLAQAVRYIEDELDITPPTPPTPPEPPQEPVG
jgi:hypothetical protein